jgi:hypothetical protein
MLYMTIHIDKDENIMAQQPDSAIRCTICRSAALLARERI